MKVAIFSKTSARGASRFNPVLQSRKGDALLTRAAADQDRKRLQPGFDLLMEVLREFFFGQSIDHLIEKTAGDQTLS